MKIAAEIVSETCVEKQQIDSGNKQLSNRYCFVFSL